MPKETFALGTGESQEEKDINTMIYEELSGNAVKVNEEISQLTAYEEKLLIKVTNGQKREVQKVNKLFYPKTIEDLRNYLLTNEVSKGFLGRLISILPSKEIELFYKNGIFSIKNKSLTKGAVSKLLLDELRAVNHLEIIKTLINTVYKTFSNTLNSINQESKSEEMFLARNISYILKRNNIKFRDIKAFKLATEGIKLNKDIEEIKKSVNDFIQNEEKAAKSNKVIKSVGRSKVKINIRLSEYTLLDPINWTDDFFAKMGDVEYREFFELLSEAKRLRSMKNKILPGNVYLLFVKYSNKENLQKLFQIEKLRISRGVIPIMPLEVIFERIIDLGVKISNIIIGNIRNYILETTGKKDLGEELESKYNIFISKNQNNNVNIRVKKEKKEELILAENGLNEELIKSFGEKQYKEFFELLALFKKGKRSNKNLMPDALYLSFVKYSNTENFTKLYDLENKTLTNNRINPEISKAYFLRLTNLTVVIGNGMNLVNRINTLRKKILLRTKKDDLDDILKTQYDTFIQRYNLARASSVTEVDIPRSPYLRENSRTANSSVHIAPETTGGRREYGGSRSVSKTIVYSSDDKQKIIFSTYLESILPNFIRNRTFDENKALYNLINKENNNVLFIDALFENLEDKFSVLAEEFVLLDKDFFKRSDKYIIRFLEIFSNEGILDTISDEIIENLESISLSLLVFLKTNSESDVLVAVLDELKRRENNKKEAKLDEENKLVGSVDKLKSVKDIETIKKELNFFFENLHNINTENGNTFRNIVLEKLDIILDDKLLSAGMYSGLHSDINNFNELYDLDSDNLDKRPDSYLGIILYLSFLSDDMNKLIRVKGICDNRGIKYEKVAGKINIRLTTLVTNDVVDKILLSATSLDLKKTVEIDGINDFNLIQKYINKQLEFNGTREIIRVFKDKKEILNSEYVASILSKLPRDSKAVRDYIINF